MLSTGVMCMSGSTFHWSDLCGGFGSEPLKVQILPARKADFERSQDFWWNVESKLSI